LQKIKVAPFNSANKKRKVEKEKKTASVSERGTSKG